MGVMIASPAFADEMEPNIKAISMAKTDMSFFILIPNRNRITRDINRAPT
jgi:hypothetical protein